MANFRAVYPDPHGSAFNIRIRIRVGKIENTGNRKMEKLYFYFETNSMFFSPFLINLFRFSQLQKTLRKIFLLRKAVGSGFAKNECGTTALVNLEAEAGASQSPLLDPCSHFFSFSSVW